MTKDYLLRLTEEHYGAGEFPVYGRLLEDRRWCWAAPTTRCWRTCWARRR